MVLQAVNTRQIIKKKSENLPPSKLGRRVSSTIREASRRRRARVVSGSQTPAQITHKSRYSYDVKHRKAKTAPARLRFQFTAPTLPAPLVVPEVEMQEAESLITKTTVVLPRHLPRPDFKDINPDVLAAIDPELAETPIEFIHEGLETIGPDMYKVLTSVKPQPVKHALPKELAILVDDLSSESPSHMLAVYSQPSKTECGASPARRSKVTLFPSHNIILAAHCANLPPLPVADSSIPAVAGKPMTVPVVPLCIPEPELYTPLSVYLYTKRLDLLYQALLPTLPTTPLNIYSSPDETTEEAQKQREAIITFARRLAATYTPHALLHYAMRVNGFWRNVCALGIFESKLWAAMDFAWESLLMGMAAATGTLEKVLADSDSSSS